MSLFSRWMPKLLRRSPLPPRVFANLNFERIDTDQKIEEETFSDYLAARYYPVRIGEVFALRYQVVGKLGYGTFSTVWLARDLNQHNHVVLKVFIRAQAMGKSVGRELDIYRHMAAVASTSEHPGRHAVRSVLDNFKVTGPDGEHQCLVHPPLWESIQAYMRRTQDGRCPPRVIGMMLYQLLSALDFMHRECRLIHADIKADNIMFSIDDNSIYEAFERDELEHPCARKEVNGRVVYASRQLAVPEFLGPPVLCDFGAAVSGETKNVTDVQPDLYRAPEIILEIPWRYEIDIWNAGCLIWDVFENRHLFSGRDPEFNTYRSRAHLASIIALLGPPPPELVARSSVKSKFFSQDGRFDLDMPAQAFRGRGGCVAAHRADQLLGAFKAGIELPPSTSLEEIETTLAGKDDREQFLEMMRKMLLWTPDRRSTANELLEDPWLLAQI
ncbi:protein kinase [Ophiostoma piceae UAMH 11346]|uniref:Protein kinase n=1 Tax=Ophiostoma piceae (strain UAMH 11346) TaxID=1262450 RepID=S3CNP8_OPHP1|nr:protein kinase [Ophiostoma piceae UAMH 11346]